MRHDPTARPARERELVSVGLPSLVREPPSEAALAAAGRERLDGEGGATAQHEVRRAHGTAARPPRQSLGADLSGTVVG